MNVVNNIIKLFREDKKGMVTLTTFDGGSTPDEFYDNFKSALSKLITLDEYNTFINEGESYVPHTVFYKNKTPEVWSEYVKESLESYQDGETDRTVVIVRAFEFIDEDKTWVPVHVEYEEKIDMPHDMSILQENLEAKIRDVDEEE